MSPAAKPALKIRQKLGKYRIERRIGEGGFAAVYQAMDTVIGARVALKIPHAPLVNEEMLSSFRREARLISTLEHVSILHFKDASIIDGRLVIAFPLGCETLNDRLMRRMSFEMILSIMDQLLGAVEIAHDNRVIHCDIKPENVIMFDNGVAKLADFGIAKVARSTVRGCGTGTIGYMAPEQAMGRPSCRSDVFSLGLLFYRMLSGEWPEWPYKWPMSGYDKLKGRVHPSMMTWLRKSIALDPRDRFQDAGQMRNSFLRFRAKALAFVKQQRLKTRKKQSDTSKPRGRTSRSG